MFWLDGVFMMGVLGGVQSRFVGPLYDCLHTDIWEFGAQLPSSLISLWMAWLSAECGHWCIAGQHQISWDYASQGGNSPNGLMLYMCAGLYVSVNFQFMDRTQTIATWCDCCMKFLLRTAPQIKRMDTWRHSYLTDLGGKFFMLMHTLCIAYR